MFIPSINGDLGDVLLLFHPHYIYIYIAISIYIYNMYMYIYIYSHPGVDRISGISKKKRSEKNL